MDRLGFLLGADGSGKSGDRKREMRINKNK